jgi:hypothetical protein
MVCRTTADSEVYAQGIPKIRLRSSAQETRTDAELLREIAARLPSRERFEAIATPPAREWLDEPSWSR